MINSNNNNHFNAAEYFIERNIGRERGGKTAIHTEKRSYTYDDINEMANKMGNAFKTMGLGIDDRIFMMMLDEPQFFAVFWGAMKIGAIPIPVNTMLTADDYEYLLNDSRAKALAISEELVPFINNIKGDLPYLRDMIVFSEDEAQVPFRHRFNNASPILNTEATIKDDVGFWLYSSGSTGSPKGTVHSQYSPVVVSERFAQKVLGLTENDVCLSAARLFFAYGIGNGMFFPMSVGAATVLNPNRPTPESIFNLLKRFRPTIFFGVPTLYGQMLDYKERQDRENGVSPDPNGNHELSSVRICVSAGEALPEDLYHRWKERFGVSILDGIGSTEMLHIFVANQPGDIKPGSSGKPVPGYELKIVDDLGLEVSNGEIGTLLVKGHSAAQYYWRNTEKTRSTMKGEWLDTGDKYYIDEGGYYWCAGRSDDMIKVGGIWVSPLEVESCLLQHPAVLECAVVGHPDEQGLIKPKAFVVPTEEHTYSEGLTEELKKWALDNLAKYKYPRWIEIVPEIPKSATGKLQRYKLRKTDKDREIALPNA